MRFDLDKPYNNLPLLPPKVDLEPKAVLRKAIVANKALAELKAKASNREDIFEALLKPSTSVVSPTGMGYGAEAVHQQTYHLAHKFLLAFAIS